METKDSKGNVLNDGDWGIVNRRLKAKGMAATSKQETAVKNIRLTGTPAGSRDGSTKPALYRKPGS